MKEISLDNWIKEGHGYTADSYRNRRDENLLLKLFVTRDGKELAEKEFARAVDVAALGIPTPKVYEIVSVGEKTGILYERIEHKRSFGRLCTDNPERLPEYAKIFAEQSKMLHSTRCDKTKFRGQKDIMRELVQKTDVSDEIKSFLMKLLEDTPDADTCLHGDLQTGNMVMGWCRSYEGRARQEGEDEKTYFIDLGHFTYGYPLFDVASLFMSAKVFQNEISNKTLLHFTSEQLEEFWKHYAISYTGSDEPETLKEFETRVAPYAMLFMVLIISVSGDDEAAKQRMSSHIEELHKQYF